MTIDQSAYAEALARCGSALVAGLYAGGVTDAVVCPGSRSTPLAILLYEHPSLRVWMHYDERSAGYFALGLARARKAPVALLSTSGTAAANFLPSVVEAQLSRVPLVVLTADRPPELRDTGAPQTIDQVHLYGRHTKWFFDFPVPGPEASLVHFSRTTGARAALTAGREPAGPVHLNLPFREPLIPAVSVADDHPFQASRLVETDNPIDLKALGERLHMRGPGLIVAGPNDLTAVWPALKSLARWLGWPVLADPLSNLRSMPDPDRVVVSTYDAVLRQANRGDLKPKQVVRFGLPPTSKALTQFLADVPLVVVDVDGQWKEPTLAGMELWPVKSLQRMRSVPWEDRARGGWLAHWQAVEQAARTALDGYLGQMQEHVPGFEGALYGMLAEWMPTGTVVMMGNSMPVRDLDSFFHGGSALLRFYGNRGASGIDGLVSTALGISAGEATRVVLIIGDLSFYHDMNGLLASKLHGLDLTALIVNNDGGGIFSFLPQAGLDPQTFEPLFGTPHGLDFAGAATVYGGFHRRVARISEVKAALRESFTRPGLSLIEWRTIDRTRNAALHRKAWDAVDQALRGLGDNHAVL